MAEPIYKTCAPEGFDVPCRSWIISAAVAFPAPRAQLEADFPFAGRTSIIALGVSGAQQ
jgi:hypothetical protein